MLEHLCHACCSSKKMSVFKDACNIPVFSPKVAFLCPFLIFLPELLLSQGFRI